MSPSARSSSGSFNPARLAGASLALAGLFLIAASSHAVQPGPGPASGGEFLSGMPLYFEGHGAEGYLARGAGCAVSIRPDGVTMTLSRRSSNTAWPFGHKVRQAAADTDSVEPRVVRLNFADANPKGVLQGTDRLAGVANYLVGESASEWRTGVPLFGKVRVNEIYPGIDAVYYADQEGRLEYDFILEPGAKPDRIVFDVTGADRLRVSAEGELVLALGDQEIRQHAPVMYQQVNGSRVRVNGGYRILSENRVGFSVGAYDPAHPLVIDPVLSFATYLGGSKAEYGWAVAVDGANNIYVAGETLSRVLPGTNGVFQPGYAGGIGSFGDAFVAKYDAATRGLVYLTYLGGRTDDGALGLAVDNTGNAYVTGFTDSRNFPVRPASNAMSLETLDRSGRTNNAFRLYPVNVFVTRLNPTGTDVDFSVLMGGSRRDSGTSIALDGTDLFVTGMTESTNFNPVPASFQTLPGGRGDAFVVRLTNPADPMPVYSTYLGGTNLDYAESIAVRGGSAYVTGFTTSSNFPILAPLAFTNTAATNGIVLDRLNMQPGRSSRMDAFVSRFSPAGVLEYSTFLGSTNDDAGIDIDVDSAGNAYVTGYTQSRWFPTNAIATPQSAATTFNTHVFVTKIGDAGSNLVYSVRFGSSRVDRGTGIAVDEANQRTYVTGFTSWHNFFATNLVQDLRGTNAITRRSARTPYDGFVVALQESAGGVPPLTFTNALLFGGTGNELPQSIAMGVVGPDVAAWVAGQTTSQDFVVTNQYSPSLVQTNLGGTRKKTRVSDAFVTEFLFP